MRVRVSPADLHSAAESMRDRAADFVAEPPPDVDNDEWPSQQAVKKFHGSVHDANRDHQRRQRGLADSVTYAADNFTAADGGGGVPAPPSGIKPQEAAVMITAATKDIMGALGAAGQAVASGVGALGSAAVSGLGAAANAAAQVGSVMVTTGAKLAASDVPGGGHADTGTIAGVGGDTGTGRQASDSPSAETRGPAAGLAGGGGAGSPGNHIRQADARVQPAEAPPVDSDRSFGVTHGTHPDSAAGSAQMMPMGVPAAGRDKTYTSKLVGKKLFADYRDDRLADEQERNSNGKSALSTAFAIPVKEDRDERPAP